MILKFWACWFALARSARRRNRPGRANLEPQVDTVGGTWGGVQKTGALFRSPCKKEHMLFGVYFRAPNFGKAPHRFRVLGVEKFRFFSDTLTAAPQEGYMVCSFSSSHSFRSSWLVGRCWNAQCEPEVASQRMPFAWGFSSQIGALW